LRHAVIDHYRSQGAQQRRHDALGTLLSQLQKDTTIPPSWEPQICSCLGGIIDTLKPQHAALLRRVDLEGQSVQAAAAELGLTSNHASVTLHRARKDLRSRLETFCGDCADNACLDCDCENNSSKL
jgi:RNA polymerase sigma-70 factor (ECF subfamily)